MTAACAASDGDIVIGIASGDVSVLRAGGGGRGWTPGESWRAHTQAGAYLCAPECARGICVYGHAVTCVAYHDGTARVASGGTDGTVCVRGVGAQHGAVTQLVCDRARWDTLIERLKP